MTTNLHILNDKWNYYYHLPGDNNWSLSSYKLIMENIDNAEAVKKLNEQIKNGIIKNTMLFVMRSDITPLWEDPKNRKGGCFSFKVLNRQVSEIWKICYAHYVVKHYVLIIQKAHILTVSQYSKKEFLYSKSMDGLLYYTRS